jgi:hypothetical protein
MVMAAGPVRVAVLDLLIGCVAKLLDRDLEMKRLAGEWVVRIDGHGILADAGDEERDLPALIVVRQHLHACGELGICWEQMSWNLLSLADARSVPLLGRDRRLDGLARAHALKLFFETRHDIHRAVEIEQRIAIRGLIDDVAVVVTEDIGETHDLICFDFLTHDRPATMSYFARSATGASTRKQSETIGAMHDLPDRVLGLSQT